MWSQGIRTDKKSIRQYFAIILLLFSCSARNSKEPCRYAGVDYVFAANYQNCMAIVSQNMSTRGVGNSDHFMNAIDCLYAITGIQAQIYRGDIAGYVSEEKYVEDMTAWADWYGRNLYQFSINDAYAKFEEYRRELEIEITWPPMLIEIWIEEGKSR